MASTTDSLLQGEPTLDELFAEPIVQLIMQRDGVERNAMQDQIFQMLEMKQVAIA